MAYNFILALIPVIAGYLFILIKKSPLRVLYGVIWFLFLPNTIYIITDILHMLEQFPSIGSEQKIILVLQYAVFEMLGLTAFILAMYPFEKLLLGSSWKRYSFYLIVLINFLVGFAIVLGRIDRVNSWEVVSNPTRVAMAVWHTVSSVESMLLVVLFGLFANFFYFLFRRPFAAFLSKLVSKLDG